jgi:predicted GNAT family acetyltransferase
MGLTFLKSYYENLGLYCRIKKPKYEWGNTIITVSSRESFALSTHDNENTGIEFYVNSDETEITINIIVVAQKHRGHGLASKLIKPIFEIIKPQTIILRDESKGFWNKVEKNHPEINWKIELEESFSEEDYEKYFGDNFDPLDRNGADGWELPNNIDDTSSACWLYFYKTYLPQNYPALSNEECDEIATIISNAMWSGHTEAWHYCNSK